MKKKLSFYCVTNFDSSDAVDSFNLYSLTDEQFESYPVSLILKLLETDPNYRLYVAKENNKFVGFSLIYFFYNLKICYVDFLSVVPLKQRQGIGTYIIESLKKIAFTDMSAIGLAYLVLTTDNITGDELTIRKKRLIFHSKVGARKFENIVFFLPPDGALEAYIIFIPIQEITLFSESTTRNLIYAIYRIYFCDNLSIINKTISSLIKIIPANFSQSTVSE